MIRILALAATLLVAVPAMAQTLQQQVDQASAEVTTVIANMRNSIMQQAAVIAQLQQQNATLTKENEELKAKPKETKEPKPTEPIPGAPNGGH